MGKPLHIPEVYDKRPLRKFQTPERQRVPKIAFLHLRQTSWAIILTVFPRTFCLVAFGFEIVEPENRLGCIRNTLNCVLNR